MTHPLFKNLAVISALSGWSGLHAQTPPCGYWQHAGSETPGARSEHVMAYDSVRQRVVLYGGTIPGSGGLDDTWEWDGSQWTRAAPADSPRCYASAAMAYDSARQRMVLFGGNGQSALTWEWDGSNWTGRPLSGPPARTGHAMAYDPLRGRVVLFGGRVGTGAPSDDTWTYDGVAWTNQTPPTRPPASEGHAMAFDGAVGRTVLCSSVGQAFVWEYDGFTWIPRPGSGPGGRNVVALAFDPTRGRIQLLGGGEACPYFSDHWEWESISGTWSRRTLDLPSPMARMGVAFDVARSQLVVMGGRSSACTAFALPTTWLLGGGPRILVQPVAVSALPGTTAVFAVEASAPAPLTYQWRRSGASLTNDGRISGAATPTLTIQNAGYPDGGEYSVTVTSTCGSTSSSTATLSFPCDLPVFAVQPLSHAAYYGQATTFTAATSGPQPVTLRWRKNGVLLSDGGGIFGTGTGTLVITSVSDSDAGAYDLTAATPCGAVTSIPAALIPTLRCPADFNGSGFVSVQDIFSYLEAYFAGCP